MTDRALAERLKRQPRNLRVRLALANYYTANKRFVDAELVLARGVQLSPESVPLLIEHGEILLDLDRVSDAIRRFREVLQLAPDHADALASLGGALLRQGDPQEAAGVLERACGALAEDGHVWALWGEALAACRQFEPAYAATTRAWQLGQRTEEMALRLAHLACETQAFAVAADFFRGVLAHRPNDGVAWHNYGKSLFELGDVTAAVHAFRTSASLGKTLSLSNIALIVPGDRTAGPDEILAARKEYARHFAIDIVGHNGAPRDAANDRPLRVGYVSSFFAKPNYMKPVYAVLGAHDQQQVQVELFHDGPATDAWSTCLENPAIEIVNEVAPLNNERLAQLIVQRDLDVLVDLNAFSAMDRLAIYTQRLAPCGVGWFNHYATSALPAIDFVFGDAETIDPKDAERFTETPVVLPVSYLAFRVDHPAPDLVAPPCLRNGYLTFGSLCTQYKITPDVLRCWAELLQRIENCRLILANRTLDQPDVVEYVRQYFADAGIDDTRLEFRGGARHYEYLKNYNDLDLALDAWPYNGGTTTTEALWQGVPVLSFRGDRWASRTTASLVADTPFGSFCANSQDAMVDLAADLAADPATPGHLANLRQQARSVLRQSSVCDVERLTRELEQAYRQCFEACVRR